ncbi:MAG TPA: hypothetical protein VF480_05600 [Verrucomicrobiae bacterium]|jgi:hypothetical protein
MKTTEERFKFWLPVQLFISLTFLFPRSLSAQGTLNALNISAGSAIVGYTPQGVGWSFVPTSDLLVTAVSSSAPQIDFWLGTNQVIATYNYVGPYGGPPAFAAPTNFQSVSLLLLSAGQTYFISTQQTNFASSVKLLVYSLNGSGGEPIFNTSSYISQFASYYLSSSGQWSSTTTPPSENANYALLGPNFQFQVVPEPTSFELSLLAVGVWLFHRRTVSTFFHVRQIFRPL